MRILRHILTGKDNKTYDIVRVGMFLGLLILCAESMWGIYSAERESFEHIGGLMKDFSVSVANILGWGSVGCAAKSHTEPE